MRARPTGPAPIWKALQFCGAERLGHGIRMVEDIVTDADGDRTLGRLAHYIRDRRIPLEVCPTSNVNTGVVASVADHPIDTLVQLRYRVTVNTDNRLMSNVSMTSEMAALADTFGYDWARLRWLTVNAMKSSFLPFRERLQIIEGVIKPGYAPLEAAQERAPCLKRRRAPGHRSCYTRGRHHCSAAHHGSTEGLLRCPLDCPASEPDSQASSTPDPRRPSHDLGPPSCRRASHPCGGGLNPRLCARRSRPNGHRRRTSTPASTSLPSMLWRSSGSKGGWTYSRAPAASTATSSAPGAAAALGDGGLAGQGPRPRRSACY